MRKRAVKKKSGGGEVCFSLPFCGAKLSDLTSDELNSKHLRVLGITDKGKNLPVRQKKRWLNWVTHAQMLLHRAVMSFIHNETDKQRQAVQLTFNLGKNPKRHKENKMYLNTRLSVGVWTGWCLLPLQRVWGLQCCRMLGLSQPDTSLSVPGYV